MVRQFVTSERSGRFGRSRRLGEGGPLGLVRLEDPESTLGSRIEVPVRLFFFGFFPLPVCLIWVYVFNSFFKKRIACLLIWDMYAY